MEKPKAQVFKYYMFYDAVRYIIQNMKTSGQLRSIDLVAFVVDAVVGYLYNNFNNDSYITLTERDGCTGPVKLLIEEFGEGDPGKREAIFYVSY